MKTKLNYSAQQILCVYKKVKEERAKAISHITLPYHEAFGNVYFKIDDVFTDRAQDGLKCEYVGYGGVEFTGNISGKMRYGLYYKSESIKREIETLIRALDIIYDDESYCINTIRDDHGEPQPQYAILWGMV